MLNFVLCRRVKNFYRGSRRSFAIKIICRMALLMAAILIVGMLAVAVIAALIVFIYIYIYIYIYIISRLLGKTSGYNFIWARKTSSLIILDFHF